MTNLTRRGMGVLAVAIAAVVFAWLFGQRSLDAVAAPAVIALLVGVVELYLADEPTAERMPLTSGFPGESRTVSIEVGGGSTVVDVVDEVPGELPTDGAEQTVAPPTTMDYDLGLDSRGEFTLGPTTVRVRDVLGLFEREVEVDTETSLLVYPAVYPLSRSGGLARLLSRALTPERQEFDDLREYVPGDPLRDVHWKSSAKHTDDLIVKEFAGREPEGSVTIAAAAAEGTADEMASAVASIAVVLLEAGVTVEVLVPDESVTAGGPDYADRDSLLATLARAGPGRVGTDVWSEADVVVSADGEEVSMTIDEYRTTFTDLRSGTVNPLVGQTDSTTGGQSGVTAT